jgi:hypothetical protein
VKRYHHLVFEKFESGKYGDSGELGGTQLPHRVEVLDHRSASELSIFSMVA